MKGYGDICKSCMNNKAVYIITFGCENATSTVLLCRDCSKYLVEHFGNLIREDEEERMRKRVLLYSLVATIIMTGCGPVKTTSDNASSLEESVTEAPPKPAAITSENIIITDDAADEASEKVIEESTSGIAIDAGDSKILESTIDQITEQMEK